MFEFSYLLFEYKKLKREILESGKIPDLTELREACEGFNNRRVINPVFAVKGTDGELLRSVDTYFNKLPRF